MSEDSPYREISALELDADFSYNQDGWTLYWECPQCHHPCKHDLRVGWVFGLDDPGDAQRRDEVIIECSCGVAHPEQIEGHDRPAEAPTGCGCFFKFVAT